MTEYRHAYQVTQETHNAARRAYRWRRWLVAVLIAGVFLAACTFAYSSDDIVIQGMAITGFVMLLVIYAVNLSILRWTQYAIANLYIGINAELICNDDGIRTRSDGRETFRAWRFVKRLEPGPEIWLVFWKPPDPVLVLPAAVFDGAAGTFALECARAAGAGVIDRRRR